MAAGTSASNLDPALIFEIDVNSDAFKQRWMDHMTEWSTRPPFYAVWDETVMVMVGRHADAMEVFSDRERFSVELPARVGFERFDKFYGVEVLTQKDGADHDRLRRLSAPAYGPAAMRKFDQEMSRILDEMLDVLPTDGSVFDIVELFGDHLMVRIMLDGMFRLDERQRAVFNQMRAVIPMATTLPPGAEFPQVYVDAFTATRATIHELIAERRASPGDDIISRLVHAREDDDQFTDKELHDAIFTLCATALQSTVSAMSGLLIALWKNPDQLAAVRSDRSLIPSAVEEGLRLHGPALFTFPRFALEDTSVGGTPIHKGMIVRVAPAAANLDPSVYPNPLTFDARRNPQKTLSFGWGSHICIAQRLARMILNRSLERILDRFPTLELADIDFTPTYRGQAGELVPASIIMRIPPARP
ncbi:cytochrome P450 [Micromonospora sp. NPDC126480]|uniref:cytochrome P450 n=1 Tax=Micromonospora sp. NPDC126480 TaxID=3155312 RepID=UPI003317F115